MAENQPQHAESVRRIVGCADLGNGGYEVVSEVELPADTVRVPRPALEYLLEHFDVGTDRTALLAVTVLQYAIGRQIDGPGANNG